MTAVVFDASSLSHFARAGRLSDLEQLTRAWDQRVTTQAVLGEIAVGVHPRLRDVAPSPWLEVVPVDGLAELRLLIHYAQLLAAGERDLGEATVLAWAEAHGATALMDNDSPKAIGRRRGVDVHGSLWFIARAVSAHPGSLGWARRLIDDLTLAGMYLPCDGAGFSQWARRHGLL